ncbi:MAG: alpha/beta hydrolase [Candidatus Kapabacteria bacterium]|nr:alpha/beta hydrolase [Candidatus Kapabacteria bacterium]
MARTVHAQSDAPTLAQKIDPILSGSWSGDFSSGSGARNRVIFHITSYENGTCSATWDIPNLAWFGNRFTTSSCEKRTLLFQSDSSDMIFEGALSPDALSIAGMLRQRRTSSAVVLKKLIESPRLQEPTAYSELVVADLTFQNRPAGVTIGGSLTMPDTLGRYPLVILAGDHGQSDRDARGSSGHAPYLVMASLFSKQNIATLRIDDRGTGQTTGTSEENSVDDEASDICAALEQMRVNPHVDTTRIVIVGHGEGGLTAAMVAQRYPTIVARIVCMGTSALDGPLALREQVGARERARETDEELITVATELLAKWCAIVAGGGTDDVIVPKIIAVTDSTIEDRPDLLSRFPMAAQFQRPDRDLYVRSTLIPWLRSYVWYKPSAFFSGVRQPMLALYAERDVEVPGEIHAKAMRAIMSSRSRVLVEVIQDVNHMFQTCDECTEEEMIQLGETMNPAVLNRISRWVLQGK